jgi:hypothetical protein
MFSLLVHHHHDDFSIDFFSSCWHIHFISLNFLARHVNHARKPLPAATTEKVIHESAFNLESGEESSI